MKRREFITLLGGATAAWPLAARAQQPLMPVVGFLSSLSPESSVHLVSAFQKGLAEKGYVEGRNVAVEYRWAYGQYDRLLALAAQLARRPVDVLATTGGEPAALAAKAVTSTVPIVFMVGGDPVKMGLVASDSRPAGNATGASLLTETMEPKRLGILRELLPKASAVAVLINPGFPPAEMQAKEIGEAARKVAMEPRVFRASTQMEIEAAFQSMRDEGLPALIVASDPAFVSRRNELIALAIRHQLATIYGFRDLAMAGGLMSYGIDLADMYRQQGLYVGRILRGEKASELPVFQPTKFDLVINLQAAKSLNIEVPDRLLALADEVIE